MVRSGFSAYELKKNDVIKCFGWTDSEYNDLMRKRPNKKKGFEHPYFSPIFQQHEGSGHKFKLTFHDLMLLQILMDFQRSKFDRSIGRFMREIIIETRDLAIWNPSDDPKDNKVDWWFSIHINPGGQQYLSLGQTSNNVQTEISSRMLFQTPDGLEKSKEDIKKATKDIIFQTELFLMINLTRIHKNVQGVLKKI